MLKCVVHWVHITQGIESMLFDIEYRFPVQRLICQPLLVRNLFNLQFLYKFVFNESIMSFFCFIIK
jgi:hypothetical protein